VLALGLIGISLYNTLFTAGLALVEASRAALIVPTNPAFTALFAALFLRERLGWLRTVGVALSMAGALWVLCRADPLAFRTVQFGLGELYLVLCILTWCIYTLLGRVALASMSALTLTAYVMAVGVLPLTVLAWNEPRQLIEVTWVSWAALAYLVFFGTTKALRPWALHVPRNLLIWYRQLQCWNQFGCWMNRGHLRSVGAWCWWWSVCT
jgi:drug/metabolite transporter (DMT)-like permease